jgi:gas vesicle protein
VQKALNLVLGFVLGGLVGSSVALLFTPMSGDELRMEVREYSRQVKDEVELAAKQRQSELERELANLRGEVVTD